jgi:hypothetical protein
MKRPFNFCTYRIEMWIRINATISSRSRVQCGDIVHAHPERGKSECCPCHDKGFHFASRNDHLLVIKFTNYEPEMKMRIGRFLEGMASTNPEQLIWLQTNLVHKLLLNPFMFGMHGSIVKMCHLLRIL